MKMDSSGLPCDDRVNTEGGKNKFYLCKMLKFNLPVLPGPLGGAEQLNTRMRPTCLGTTW